MLDERVNSLLRPVLDGRKHTDQGCLELFRFLHSVHPFERGRRAGHGPAQLVGLDVPDDALTLLAWHQGQAQGQMVASLQRSALCHQALESPLLSRWLSLTTPRRVTKCQSDFLEF